MIWGGLRKAIQNYFYRGSIRVKLIWIIMTAVLSVLIFAAIGLITSTFFYEKSRIRMSVETLAEIVGANSTAALVFHDEKTLNETLASLGRRPGVLRGCIYDSTGGIVGSFVRSDQNGPCPPEAPPVGSGFGGGHLLVTKPILLEGRKVGSFMIESQLQELKHTIAIQVISILVLLFLSAILALQLSRWLERFVSRPILQLASTAQTISEKKDYSIRVTPQSGDEISVLIGAFNHLLGQVQQQAEEMEGLLQEAREAVATRDDFLSIASHELRTPLTSLKLQIGFIKELVEKKRLADFPAEKLTDLLKITGRHISHLCRLVEDLLNVTQITSGKLSFQPQPVEIGPLIRGVIQQFLPEIAASGSVVELIVDQKESKPGFWDPFRIEQVIINLLSNALKYGDRKPILISVHNEGETAVIVVKDQGIGVGPEDQGKIFHRFERAVSSRHFGGLGLGLYITREIVKAHHGEVSVKSEFGKGSTFTVKLPLLPPVEKVSRAS